MTVALQHAVLPIPSSTVRPVHRDSAVVIEGAQISRIVQRSDLPTSISAVNLPAGTWLAPGFIDCQVNGGGDVLFNDVPTVPGINAIARAHRRFGTTLAASNTDHEHQRKRCDAALKAAEEAALQNPSILGIHLEGPFLSPEKPGVHDPASMRAPTADDVRFLRAAKRHQTGHTRA